MDQRREARRPVNEKRAADRAQERRFFGLIARLVLAWAAWQPLWLFLSDYLRLSYFEQILLAVSLAVLCLAVVLFIWPFRGQKRA